MENEIMNYEDEVGEPEVENTEVETEESKMGTGVAMLIGAGLTLAVGAVVKIGKKAIAKIKAKKELKEAEERDFVTPTDEEIQNVTK